MSLLDQLNQFFLSLNQGLCPPPPVGATGATEVIGLTGLTGTVLSNPSAYPATRPVSALAHPILFKESIYSTLVHNFSRYNYYLLLAEQSSASAYLGLPSGAEMVSARDYALTARFDLASHYARAFDHSQETPLSALNRMTTLVGRQLSGLIDQHFYLSDLLLVKELAEHGGFTGITGAQASFLQRYLVVEVPAVPYSDSRGITGDHVDRILARFLLRNKALVRGVNNVEAVTGPSSNVGANLSALLTLTRRYDPLTDLVNNGKKVVSLLSNVYRAISTGRNPSTVAEITTPQAENLAFFGQVVRNNALLGTGATGLTGLTGMNGSNPLIGVQALLCPLLNAIGTTGATGTTGLTGANSALTVWNRYLQALQNYAHAQALYSIALKKGEITLTDPRELGRRLMASKEAVLEQSNKIGALFALSLGVNPAGPAVPYPRSQLL